MKIIKKIILLLFIGLLFVCGVTVKEGYDKFQNALKERPIESVIKELKGKENYTVYENIPAIYFDAVVAVEDRRFYIHNGFDIVGTLRALYNDLRAGELLEGGSTLSQQLAKNLYFPQDSSLTRKIAEMFMAMKMENQYEKKDILEFYVNAIYYGSGYYCIYDASVGYFDKEPKDMTEDECTLLAGIPNAPSVYSLDVNPELARKRQEKVIQSMVACGYLEDSGR